MKPELLAPAGDWPSLRAAIESGADAVYFGLQAFNMRHKAKNFKTIELKKIVDFCHANKAKAYLVLNTIIYDSELKKLETAIIRAKKAKVDAIIGWDQSVLTLAKKNKIPVHLSTQASVSNELSAKFYKKQGIERIIPARELNLNQVKKLAKVIDLEIFIHGALCYSISGRCFLSQLMYSKSANRGECIQPCRRKYILTDEETKKQIKVDNKHMLSPKDLCTLPILNKLIKTGVKSLKIEGRNRSPEYVKTIVAIYRKAIDEGYTPKLLEQAKKVYNREFSTNFYLGTPTADDLTKLYGSGSTEKKQFIGKVQNYYSKHKVAAFTMLSRTLKLGDEIWIIGNKTGIFRQKITSLEKDKKPLKSAKKGDFVSFKVDKRVRSNDQIYKIIRRKL